MNGNIERKLGVEMGSFDLELLNGVLVEGNTLELKFEDNCLGKILVKYNNGEVTGKARWKPIKNKLKNGKKPATKYSGVYEWAKFDEKRGYYWGK